MRLYRDCFKRVFDFAGALILLVLLSPLLLGVTVWLHFANKGAGAFFSQERPGKDEKIFKLYKFKSMTDERDSDGNLLPATQRLTKVGAVVRKTSIDELPQLWNVLKGDMSMIGPRPLLVSYLDHYNTFQRHRHDVRPGITGWAQIKGRNAITWRQKFAYDVWYVSNLSLFLDIKIAFLTLKGVFASEGVSLSADKLPTESDFLE